MAFGDRLEKLREETGFSVKELARRLGIRSPNTIQRWIDGTIQPRLDEAAKVADFFGRPLCWMVDDGRGRPITEDELSRGEFAVVTAFRALRIGAEEAVRRLQAGGGGAEVTPRDPLASPGGSSGKTPDAGSNGKGGKRKGAN